MNIIERDSKLLDPSVHDKREPDLLVRIYRNREFGKCSDYWDCFLLLSQPRPSPKIHFRLKPYRDHFQAVLLCTMFMLYH